MVVVATSTAELDIATVATTAAAIVQGEIAEWLTLLVDAIPKFDCTPDQLDIWNLAASAGGCACDVTALTMNTAILAQCQDPASRRKLEV